MAGGVTNSSTVREALLGGMPLSLTTTVASYGPTCSSNGVQAIVAVPSPLSVSAAPFGNPLAEKANLFPSTSDAANESAVELPTWMVCGGTGVRVGAWLGGPTVMTTSSSSDSDGVRLSDATNVTWNSPPTGDGQEKVPVPLFQPLTIH